MMSVVCLVVNAQYTQLPQIPNNTFNVVDYGAVGDGKTLNTVAIQKALNNAKEKGGSVLVPKGVFLCGPLVMFGKTNLQLAKGTVLKLRNDIDSFPVQKDRYLNFITISNAFDIKISGEGTIDGQGEIWWKKYTAKEITFRRPQMLFIEKTSRIEVSGITFLNPPNTHFSLKTTTEVYIHDITIKAPAESRNTDGINISAKNCTIEKCTINTGDDNIAINFGSKNLNSEKDPECKNILIQKCFFGYGHGLSIGSFTSGGLDNLKVLDCKFDGTTSGIRIKTARGRGGVVQNLSYANIELANCKWPIFISEYYPKEPKTPQEDTVTVRTDFTPIYKNISLRNITITNAGDALKIWGIPESPIQNILFEKISIVAKYGLQIYNAQNVEFKQCDFNIEKGEKIKTFQADVKGL